MEQSRLEAAGLALERFEEALHIEPEPGFVTPYTAEWGIVDAEGETICNVPRRMGLDVAIGVMGAIECALEAAEEARTRRRHGVP